MKTTFYFLVILSNCFLNAQCFQSFSSGAAHSITIKSDGTLWSWGDNNSNEVGVCNGSLSVFTPRQISNQPIWSKVFAVSNRTFIIKNDGTLWLEMEMEVH